MIQPGSTLVEPLAFVAGIRVQPDGQPRSRLEEQHTVPGVFAFVMGKRHRHSLRPEHPLIPGHAGFDVADGHGKVMYPSNRWGGSLGHRQDGAMSNDSAAAIRQERLDWMARHRDIYLRSGGTEGHIMDIREIGGHAFTTHCLIRLKGRKSGRTIIKPLIYGDIGGEVVIVGSKGGS